jgi:hypothetical protein
VEKADGRAAEPEMVRIARNVLRDARYESVSLDRRQRSALHERLGERNEIVELGIRKSRGRRRRVDLADETDVRVLDVARRVQDRPRLHPQAQDGTAKQ